MKTLIILLNILNIFLASASDILSKDKLFPTYVKTQYAGNMGLISIGAGRSFFNEKLCVDINYGYLPKEVNGVQVHTFAAKSAYHLKGISYKNINSGYYFGTGLAYAITSKTYLKYPGYFPDGYYPPNAIYFNPFMGFKISFPIENKRIDKMMLFTEIGSVDYQIWYAIKNREINYKDVVNFSFGLGFTLK